MGVGTPHPTPSPLPPHPRASLSGPLTEKTLLVLGSKCQTSLLWRVTDAPPYPSLSLTHTHSHKSSLQSLSQPELPASWGRTNSLYNFGIRLFFFSPFLSFSPLILLSALSNSLILLSPLPLSVTDILPESRVPDFSFSSLSTRSIIVYSTSLHSVLLSFLLFCPDLNVRLPVSLLCCLTSGWPLKHDISRMYMSIRDLLHFISCYLLHLLCQD